MRTYIIFNFFIQVLILITSVNLYFENQDAKLLYSLLLIGIIFIPSLIEFISHKKSKKCFHYVFTLICLLLFLFLIAF